MRKRAWFLSHVKSFVNPRVGSIAKLDDLAIYEKHLPGVLRVWKAAKEAAKGRTILLPGRDTWVLEILARLEDYPTLFRPEISGTVAYYIYQGWWKSSTSYSKYYCIDSGYSGSVPRALGCKAWNLVSGTNRLGASGVFESVAGFMEGIPKYWVRGNVVGGKIVQSYSNDTTFRNAAIVTRMIARYALLHPKD